MKNIFKRYEVQVIKKRVSTFLHPLLHFLVETKRNILHFTLKTLLKLVSTRHDRLNSSQPYVVRRATRSSLSMPCHALAVPTSRTVSTGRTFINAAVQVWNSLPDDVVGISDNGTRLSRAECISI